MNSNKGEWKIGISYDKYWPVFRVKYLEDPNDEIAIKRIAQLFQAAPKLLEASENLLATIGPGGYFPGAGKTRTKALRQAVAKAKKGE